MARSLDPQKKVVKAFCLVYSPAGVWIGLVMRKLLWASDLHLDHLPLLGARSFGQSLVRDHPDAEGLVVTGDIGSYAILKRSVTDLQAGFRRPVWFVLGNHDAYGGSVEQAQDLAREVSQPGRLAWLQMGNVPLGPGVWLVGVDGWYDARAGDPDQSKIAMSDWTQIDDFRGLISTDIIRRAKAIARESARQARVLLKLALDAGARTIVFATHVPPFPGASWHEGEISDIDAMPWYCNITLGQVLIEVGEQNPDVQFLVLCGHTHSRGIYEALPNMYVMTAASEYGDPQVNAVIEPEHIKF